MIVEPTVEETTKILKGLQSRYEAHHQVRYSDDAIRAAAKLASRHLRESRLPDSAIDVVDEAGAALSLDHSVSEKENEIESPVVTISALQQVVSRMARIPEKQTSSSDRDRLRTLEESLRRVVFGQPAAVQAVVTAIKRARAGLAQPARLSLIHI